MEKLVNSGINLHKAIAMGMHDKAYGKGDNGYEAPAPAPKKPPKPSGATPRARKTSEEGEY